LIDSSGSILVANTNNLEDEFITPSEEEFNKALEGKAVSIDRSIEKKTAVMIKINNLLIHIFLFQKILSLNYFNT
jgi:hypothetical protein